MTALEKRVLRVAEQRVAERQQGQPFDAWVMRQVDAMMDEAVANAARQLCGVDHTWGTAQFAVNHPAYKEFEQATRAKALAWLEANFEPPKLTRQERAELKAVFHDTYVREVTRAVSKLAEQAAQDQATSLVEAWLDRTVAAEGADDATR